MKIIEAFKSLWRRLMTRNTAFSSRYSKLRILYSMEDPWEMSSLKEQARFLQTNEILKSICGDYGAALEIGCGEGHQTTYLTDIWDRVVGVDLSARAIKRARRRCPKAEFKVAGLNDLERVFPDTQFDLITACEVLYYAKDIKAALELCKQMAPRIFVSNFRPRSVLMEDNFSGPGWRRLESIEYDDTAWDCFVWERSKLEG